MARTRVLLTPYIHSRAILRTPAVRHEDEQFGTGVKTPTSGQISLLAWAIRLQKDKALLKGAVRMLLGKVQYWPEVTQLVSSGPSTETPPVRFRGLCSLTFPGKSSFPGREPLCSLLWQTTLRILGNHKRVVRLLGCARIPGLVLDTDGHTHTDITSPPVLHGTELEAQLTVPRAFSCRDYYSAYLMCDNDYIVSSPLTPASSKMARTCGTLCRPGLLGILKPVLSEAESYWKAAAGGLCSGCPEAATRSGR
ncbi:hypothetical protein GW7_19197 [Heterocephalus glaber]|uniref:Uncharacterized protein n=1 Tax=Heterocephalus glaber TaxID=10181 RepID=G5C461_HETGA|nr:hypothetical protein GW7_19197 [Heterocephalus glaber]